jgi:hypothetical protein
MSYAYEEYPGQAAEEIIDDWEEQARDRREQRAELIAKALKLTSYSDFDKTVALDFIIKNLFAKGHTCTSLDRREVASRPC